MFCLACGTPSPVDQRCCPHCGAGKAGRCSGCATDLPAGARFCPACGQAVDAAARPGVPAGENPARPATGERKQLTVLFADFADFTAFASQLDAEEVQEYMQALWARLDAIVAGHGGVTEKHIGDAIMAVFGIRQAREDDPAQAVRAALAMQACVGDLKRLGAQKALQMRVGIHTGLVVLGPAGAVGEWSTTGETVNLASRLEHSAPVGGVLVSQDTYRHVYGLFVAQPQPPLTVKGLAEPVQTYQVLCAQPRAVALQLRGVEGVETEMIGRELELGRLQSALQSVAAGRQLQVVTVVGEAGIGKSCLLREFQKWLDLLPQTFRLFGGRASAEMTSLPFALLRDVFFARFEILESDPAAVAREKLERGVAGLLGSNADAAWSAGEVQAHAHFIGQLLGLDFSASPWLRDILSDPDQIRHRALDCLSRFFTAISQGSAAAQAPQLQGLLLVLDELHWADDGSLDAIAHLVRAGRDAPILIVCLARPSLFERRPGWGAGWPGQARLHLGPLLPAEGRALVESILRKAPEIPQALRELVVGGAEGNPFFIEEIIKMLMDQKVILPGPEEWHIEPGRLAAAKVPATLTAVLQARLDGLTPWERAVIQRASVVGRVFWDRVVERLGGPADAAHAGALPAAGDAIQPETLAALAGLRRKELILRRESSTFAGAGEYTFKHELLRNVAYESLLRKSRRSYHAQVAVWLIEQGGERIGEFAGLVATHFEEAGCWAEAAVWHGRAGRQAQGGYAPATAFGHFQKALDLLSAADAGNSQLQPQCLDWHQGLGETLGAQARFTEALEAYARMRSLAEALGDDLAQARAGNGLAFLHERRGDNRASVQAAEQAEALARQAGPTGLAERIKALHLKGWAYYRMGDAVRVLNLAEQTLDLCSASGDRRGMATSYKLFGVAHLQLGHYAEADRYFTQGLELYQALGERRNAGAMWSNLGESARLRGDYQSAAELYQKALAIARQIGHRESEIIYLNNLSGAQLGLRQFEEAEVGLRQVITLAGTSNHGILSEAYTFLAEACLGQGKLAEALDAARRARVIAQEMEDNLSLGGAWRTLGKTTAQVARSHSVADPTDLEPDACFQKSLLVFEQMKAEGEQARTLREWGFHELQQGRTAAGRERLAMARGIFLRLGMGEEVARTEG